MKMNMFRHNFFITAIFAVAALIVPVHAAKIHVVTTLTDLADLAREIGKDHVDVRSLATGIEDTHGVPMKPSFVPILNKADLVIVVGFDCEHAFLPALLEASKNPRIQIGHAGYVDCARNIVPKDVPNSIDHSAGDVHPYGNPHYMLDPVLAKTAVNEICEALVTFDPKDEAYFTGNRDAYLSKLDAKIAEWKEKLKPLKDVQFVSYHEHWPYFADRFGLRYVATIELKPGIDPTPHHIEDLIKMMKADGVPLVVREPQFPEKVPRLIAEKTGAALVTLPIMPGGVANTDTYIDMMDYIVNTVKASVKGK